MPARAPADPTQSGQDWRTLAEAHARRNRREQRLTVIELGLGSAAFVLCLYAAALPGPGLAAHLAWVALAMLAAGFSLWAWRSRRRHWTETTPAPAELIALEKRRLNHRLLYWRLSAWIVCGLWVAMGLLLTIIALHYPGAVAWLQALFLATALSLPVLLLTVVISYQVRQGTPDRVKRLQAMARQLPWGTSD